jgi:hypothetical protein
MLSSFVSKKGVTACPENLSDGDLPFNDVTDAHLHGRKNRPFDA